MKKSFQKVFQILAVFVFFASSLFSEELNDLNFSWQRVLSGKVISKPAVTSYGFCVITDARKIDSVANNGQLLWEKELPNARRSNIFSLSADFLLILSNDGTLVSLLNPSGKELWNCQLDFEAVDVFSGRDGRFFIFNQNSIACFGINGIKKWQISVPVFDCSSVFEFEDGYIYANCISSGKSVNQLLKFSPFGEFELFDNSKNQIKNPDEEYKKYIVYHQDKNGFFYCTKNNAEYVSEQNISLFSATFPSSAQEKDSWKYALLTSDFHLVICKENWTLNAYKVIQEKFEVKPKSNYNNFLNLNNYYSSLVIDEEVIAEQRISAVKNGNYSQNEKLWTSQALNILNNYNYQVSSKEFGTGIEYSLYEMNTTDFAKVVSQISLFGTTDFTELTADFIRNCKNKTMLKLFLFEVVKYGYDPYGNILDSIDYIAKTINPKNEEIICVMCDAIYSLCYFMGRPVYNSKGRQLMAEFVSVNSTDRVRTHARRTLAKIKALNL